MKTKELSEENVKNTDKILINSEECLNEESKSSQNEENFDLKINDVITNTVEEMQNSEDSKSKTTFNSSSEELKETKQPPKDKVKKKIPLFLSLFLYFLAFILISIILFSVYNMFTPNISFGLSVRNIDVSNQNPSDAKYMLEDYLKNNLPDEIKIKHNEFESTISLEQINAHFDIKSAVNEAFMIGKSNNIIKNDLVVIDTMIHKKNIIPDLVLDNTTLSKVLSELSPNLPDTVEESSYYLEGNQLIITPGKQGNAIDVEKTIELIKNTLINFENYKDPIEIAVTPIDPKPIDIEKIHSEIYKLPQDAYYNENPFTIIPSKNGTDFKISIDEAKKIISQPGLSEYKIPLKILYPKVTTNMIGTQAFPDLLATYSSYYNASNTNRTTNLILATNKINGKVLMPEEVFSFNKIVGRRTVAAGYKNASIYVNGKSVDGLAGGICQTASTLYNAALLSNLGIVERHNHQIHPPYAPVSRDATVVYGSQDFKFKNTRNYPVKLMGYVSGGVTTFKIFGKKEQNEPTVELSSYITHQTPTTISSEGYRILKQNGKVISKALLSKDTYIKEKK